MSDPFYTGDAQARRRARAMKEGLPLPSRLRRTIGGMAGAGWRGGIGDMDPSEWLWIRSMGLPPGVGLDPRRL
jgi:hypothetical protein